jgi:hypothetical protein
MISVFAFFLYLNKKTKLFFLSFLKKIIDQRKINILIIILSTIISVVIKLYFYLKFTYYPTSDPQVFFDTASKIASGAGVSGDTYIALFPYLAAYDNLLAVAMHLIKDQWLSIIVLNSVFEIIGAISVYLIFKRILNTNTIIAALGYCLWIISPFNIIFSLISLPIIIVNTLLSLSILLGLFIIKNILHWNFKSIIKYSTTLGILIGIANLFRPIFIIFIIALLIIYMLIFFESSNKNLNIHKLITSISLICAIFIAIQIFSNIIISKEISLKASINASGWSIYVGSNSENNGMWNINDQNNATKICSITNEANDCQVELQKYGIERYKQMDFFELTSLSLRKLGVLASNQTNIYNADQSIIGYGNSRAKIIMNVYIELFIIYIYSMSTFSFYFLSIRSKIYMERYSILLLALLFLGFFFSHIFVEVSWRYSQVIYPIFIISSLMIMDNYFRRLKIS